MPLIVMKTRQAASLGYLWRLVLKYIYDEDHMTLDEEELIKSSLEVWRNKFNRTDEETYWLNVMAKMLNDNAAGKFDARKGRFEFYKINYKKFFGLPEAYLNDKPFPKTEDV